MKFKHQMYMKATVKKKTKGEGLEFDEKHFKGMKPDEIKVVGERGDYIIGIEKSGTKYVKLITGWYYFKESEK